MPNAQCPLPNAPSVRVFYRCRGEASCEEDGADGDRFAQLRSGLRTSVEQAVARQKLVSAILRHPTDAAETREGAVDLPLVISRRVDG
jgi:hypothetical protein